VHFALRGLRNAREDGQFVVIMVNGGPPRDLSDELWKVTAENFPGSLRLAVTWPTPLHGQALVYSLIKWLPRDAQSTILATDDAATLEKAVGLPLSSFPAAIREPPHPSVADMTRTIAAVAFHGSAPPAETESGAAESWFSGWDAGWDDSQLESNGSPPADELQAESRSYRVTL
jgi:hypothetical protein